MLEFRLWGIPCRVSLLFPIMITALLLCESQDLTVTCIFASFIHECGHLFVMCLLGVKPEDCVVGSFGLRIRIRQGIVGYGRNILMSLAGPLTNGMVAVAFWAVDRFLPAAVNLWLALVNLLPIAALDGGEIVQCLCGLCGAASLSDVVLRYSSILCLSLLFVAGLWIQFCLDGNPTLLIVSLYLATMSFFSEKLRKTS